MILDFLKALKNKNKEIEKLSNIALQQIDSKYGGEVSEHSHVS